jgi:hypothetical protein
MDQSLQNMNRNMLKRYENLINDPGIMIHIIL